MSRLTHQQALEYTFADRMPRKDGYVELPTTFFADNLDVNLPPLPAVGFYQRVDGKIRTLREAQQPYSLLALTAFESILVKEEEFDLIKKYAETLILGATGGGYSMTLPPEKRMESLRRSAMLVVEDLFLEPTPEKIAKTQRVVGSFVYVLMRDPKAYFLLAKLSSHDPYTLQHSVGTAVNCIILAKKMGINSETDLMDVGLAGLLHDIGKVKVRKEIINKEGPLDELEWEEMREHSQAGYDIVKDFKQISERTKMAILEHHENPNGTGYPQGLKGDMIDIFARIVCISDIFNALTTNRTYSKARTPFDAFQFMREKLHHKIDDELFKNLVMIYGGNFDGT